MESSSAADMQFSHERPSLAPHSCLTFRSLDGYVFHGDIANNSLFANTSFTKCDLGSLNLNHSDLQSCVFTESRIAFCDLSKCDIRTIVAENCVLESVSFDESVLCGCEFRSCLLRNCTFKGSTIEHCTFENCEIDGYDNEHGSAILNNFIESDIRNAEFRNVSYYQVFQNCSFSSTVFELYLLGFSYGLSKANLNEMTLLRMGKAFYGSPEQAIAAISEIYHERQMWLNIEFLAFLSQNTSPDEVFCRSLCVSLASIDHGIVVQAEHVGFFSSIFDSLCGQNAFCGLMMWQSLCVIDTYFNKQHHIAAGKAEMELHALFNIMRQRLSDLIASLEWYDLPLPKRQVRLEAKFESKPSCDFMSIIRACSDGVDPLYLNEREGSWIMTSVVPPDCIPGLLALAQMAGCFVLQIGEFAKEALDAGGSIATIASFAVMIKRSSSEHCATSGAAPLPNLVGRELQTYEKQKTVLTSLAKMQEEGLSPSSVRECYSKCETLTFFDDYEEYLKR